MISSSTVIQILGLAGKFKQMKRTRITLHFVGNDPQNTEALEAPDASKTEIERVSEAQRGCQTSSIPLHLFMLFSSLVYLQGLKKA